MVDNLDPNRQAGHFWKYLAMGPDGKLYFNIGAPGNIVMPTYMRGVDHARRPEQAACSRPWRTGVRNSVGMDFDPKTKELWFTNHARDWLGDDMPNDTLHRVAQDDGAELRLSVLPPGRHARSRIRQGPLVRRSSPSPALKLGAHIAPLGMQFYNGKMFPAEYQGNIFIAHARLVEPQRPSRATT